MKVLTDSSVWIAYFRGSGDLTAMEWLLEEGLIVINELILAELTPPLLLRGERKLAALLREVECLPLTVDWDNLIELQVTCLRHGINKVGLPDLIIAQHALQNELALFSHDKHFALLARHLPLRLH